MAAMQWLTQAFAPIMKSKMTKAFEKTLHESLKDDEKLRSKRIYVLICCLELKVRSTRRISKNSKRRLFPSIRTSKEKLGSDSPSLQFFLCVQNVKAFCTRMKSPLRNVLVAIEK